MAQRLRRRGRSRITRKSFTNIGSKLFPFVKAVSAPIAFLEQLTAKDRQINASAMAGASATTQAKMLLNFVTGRLAGFGLFKNTGAVTPSQTINPSGVINKWTNAGLIGIGYKVLGGSINKMSRDMGMGSVVPETSRVGSIAKSVLIGGALGGFFDDPPERVQVQTPQRNIIRAIPNTFNNTTDNTESGF